MRAVVVTAHNKDWPKLYEQEREEIIRIFGSKLHTIHHIGSTSVPGLAAKPIIDIMPVVNDIKQVDCYNHAMEELGYVPKGENGIAGRRYFQKGGDHRTHHVHIYEHGNSEINRHLQFRDYLILHPVIAQEYGDLKLQLAKKSL